jgi:thymidylate synthase (FAD)
MSVKLVWATPNGEELVAYMARVSNPDNQDNAETAPKLLKYLINNKHWSPFEMVNMCVEIETTRDIARQILRHRSFSFQEFSQRYAEVDGPDIISIARLQDSKNRQNSLETDNEYLQNWWLSAQARVADDAEFIYREALKKGIAKEVARKVLPEGLTPTRMYMNGTLRSWLHYVDIRCDAATQKEHREVAEQCKALLVAQYPTLKGLLYEEG